MMPFLITLTFVTGFLLVFGVNLLIADLQFANRQSVRLRLEEERRAQNREDALLEVAKRAAADQPSALSELSQLDASSGWRQRLALFVEQSGKRTTVGQLMLLSILFAIAAAAIPVVLLHQWLAALIAAPFAAFIPWLYNWRARSRRLEHLRGQLPDVFDLMSRVLRAGQTIPQALETVAEEVSRPASEEFGYVYEQQNLGLSPEAAMRDLARRTGLLELKIFVLAVMVHRQTGGNLADLLNKLAMIIRDRYRVHGTIRAMTAEGRLQATILLALPPLLLGAITLINRTYASVLFQHPNLLIGMFAFMVAGAVWMQRIVHFDF